MTMAAAAPSGLMHSVGFYASDEEFVRMFAPYCREGLERDEATVVRVAAGKSDLLRSALGDPPGVDFLPHGDQYANAPGAMAAALDLIGSYTARGARRIRLLGELPTLTGLGRDAWLRYEAAVNRVLRLLPVDALCACDRRTVSDTVHDELLRTHHGVATPDGARQPSPAYEVPEAFVAGRMQSVRDAMEDLPPAVAMIDPAPSDARVLIGNLGRSMGIAAPTVDGLLLAVSEVLGNAIMHGAKPVELRAWGQAGRVVVAVRDHGAGPRDPFVGLVPVEPGARVGGLGLWIAHQLCPEIALSTGEGSFTVRIAVGAPQRLSA